MSGEGIELEGIVEEVCRGGKFKVRILDSEGKPKDHVVDAHPSGKMRKFSINIVLGDRVKVEVSPYSLDKGRITYRNR